MLKVNIKTQEILRPVIQKYVDSVTLDLSLEELICIRILIGGVSGDGVLANISRSLYNKLCEKGVLSQPNISPMIKALYSGEIRSNVNTSIVDLIICLKETLLEKA